MLARHAGNERKVNGILVFAGDYRSHPVDDDRWPVIGAEKPVSFDV